MEPWWDALAPWVHVPGLQVNLEVLQARTPLDYQLIILHGSRMRDKSGLMGEFQRALEFPGYFGRNWSALEDCLQDLTWLQPRSGYLLAIADFPLVLEGDSGDCETLMEVLESVGSVWGAEGHGNGPVAFNTVFLDPR